MAGPFDAHRGEPTPRAKMLRAVAKRVVVGRPASPRVYAELGTAPADLLSAVERCFTESLCLAFAYVDRHGATSVRTVEPHGLLVETPAFYLLARDRTKRAVRMFRLDRIERARVLEGQPFVADLDAVREEWLRQSQAGSSGSPAPLEPAAAPHEASSPAR